MSLDVYLKLNKNVSPCFCECGNAHVAKNEKVVYWANITHNLGKMASENKIGNSLTLYDTLYNVLWEPKEHGISNARQLIEPLQIGLANLKTSPDYFKGFDSPNGWGLYENFVPFVEEYLQACLQNPTAIVEISR